MLMKFINLPFIETLKSNLSVANLIQVVQGPRQVGKTTGVTHFLKSQKKPYHYISADGILENEFSWILNEWQKACNKKVTYFVIDEIQKIRNWSEIIKKIWDEKLRYPKHKKIKFILLGSSSLKIQKGPHGKSYRPLSNYKCPSLEFFRNKKINLHFS